MQFIRKRQNMQNVTKCQLLIHKAVKCGEDFEILIIVCVLSVVYIACIAIALSLFLSVFSLKLACSASTFTVDC